MILFFKGLELSNPINGAVLMLATPVFVHLLAIFSGVEKLSILRFTGILIAIFGCLMLMGGLRFSFSSQTLYGDIMLFLNAVFFAIYLVIVRPLVRSYHPFTVSAYTFLFGALLVIPFGFSQLTEIRMATLPDDVLLKMIYLVVATTFITYLLNAWAVAQVGSTVVGNYIYLQPILATVIAVGLGKDHLTAVKLLSGLLIFIGVFLSSRKTGKEWQN
jgi:drug/metabolite transporter (DMT)-like permease